MGHSAGAQESLEMLDGMLYSIDQPEQISTEKGRVRTANVVCCSVNCGVTVCSQFG